MKKLLKLITMLFLASAMVISCGGGSGSDAPSTSDCTETVTTLELSDGEWTVYVDESNDFSASKMELEATVKNGAYEFTSGKASATVDLEKAFSTMGDEMFEGTGITAEDAIEMLESMPDEQKNAMLRQYMGIPEGYDLSWNGLTLKVKGTASAEDLANMEDFLDLDYLPNDAEIKTNADRTKFTINVSFDGEEMEIIAIKK